MLYKLLQFLRPMLTKELVELEEQVLDIVIDYTVLKYIDNSFSKIIFLKFKEPTYAM
jgi:hypothetical protein